MTKRLHLWPLLLLLPDHRRAVVLTVRRFHTLILHPLFLGAKTPFAQICKAYAQAMSFPHLPSGTKPACLLHPTPILSP